MWVPTHKIIQAIKYLSIVTPSLNDVYANNYFAYGFHNYGESLSLKFLAFKMVKEQKS